MLRERQRVELGPGLAEPLVLGGCNDGTASVLMWVVGGGDGRRAQADRDDREREQPAVLDGAGHRTLLTWRWRWAAPVAPAAATSSRPVAVPAPIAAEPQSMPSSIARVTVGAGVAGLGVFGPAGGGGGGAGGGPRAGGGGGRGAGAGGGRRERGDGECAGERAAEMSGAVRRHGALPLFGGTGPRHGALERLITGQRRVDYRSRGGLG